MNSDKEREKIKKFLTYILVVEISGLVEGIFNQMQILCNKMILVLTRLVKCARKCGVVILRKFFYADLKLPDL